MRREEHLVNLDRLFLSDGLRLLIILPTVGTIFLFLSWFTGEVSPSWWMDSVEASLSLNFARLYAARPGYGYAGAFDPSQDDGIDSIDLRSGQRRRIIALAELAKASDHNPSDFHWVNHLQINREGTRFALLYRRRTVTEAKPFGWSTRLLTANLDATERYLLNDHGMISHYD